MSNEQDSHGVNGPNVWWETQPTPRDVGFGAPSDAARLATESRPIVSTPQKGYTGLKRELICPSGRKFTWHRPPRNVFWKHGIAALAFSDRVQAMLENIAGRYLAGEDLERTRAEEAARLYEGMSEEQRLKTQAYVDDVIVNSVDLEPDESPNDLEDGDYWHIFNYTTYLSKAAPIQTKEGETDTQTVETFPEEQRLSADSASGPNVRGAEPVAAHGNP
jgi:hypothetical protein